MTAVEYYGDNHGLPADEKLVAVKADFRESSESTLQPSTPSTPQDYQEDPGLNVLAGLSNPLHIYPAHPTRAGLSASMAEQQDEPPPAGEAPALQVTGVPLSGDHGPKASVDSAVDLSADVVEPDEGRSDSVLATKELATWTRTDSMQSDALPTQAPSLPSLASPLRIKISESSASATHPHEERDSISASPTLSKHVIPAADVNGQSLAPFEPPSPSHSSPKAERLPSIHQITNSLTELAEAATQEMPRQQQSLAHHHSQSFGSTTCQSPSLPGRPYPMTIQTSPQAYYSSTLMARSPTSTIGESQYASSPAYPPYEAYGHRRLSMADGVPPPVPNLPTASSSGDSYGGYHSSGTEGYSTSHTTPIDIGHMLENAPRPMLPPPLGMHALAHPHPAPIMIPGPYKCDVPNCIAGTFQTQYLLNSHKNVHSQSRPHYCPVAGCSRSEGGKGFKRKNEMIRHGLVHNSPGYICPFCPEREHRYPRPDNLQRHVRVHHVDRDRDDNILRDVLNQRTEGQGKTRRRRTNTGLLIAASM